MNHKSYLSVTRSASYGFLAALPLLLAYEVLILLVNEGTSAPVRVGADVWIKQLIALVGDPGMLAIGIVVLIVGGVVFFRDRKRGLPLRFDYLGWMLLESTVYAVLVALLVSSVVGAIFYNMAIVGPQEQLGLGRMLALSLGAGLYEELVFRVILVGGLFWFFSWVLKPSASRVPKAKATGLGTEGSAAAAETLGDSAPGGAAPGGKTAWKAPRRGSLSAYLLAAVVGAVAFSAVHYTGTFGDPFTMPSFTFRFLFGLALNALYLWRGFGIAAWTHAIYDVLVVTDAL